LKTTAYSKILISISLVISLPINIAYGQHKSSSVNNSKLVILTFGDTLKGQITTAKPILDKYGFKASFFITCNWVGLQKSKSPRLTWQDISSLQKDGQDIESKTMTHRDLSNLSATDLNFEVAQSKKCLSDHGINNASLIMVH
jgi:peptidoglycan/xylan/chitin deacetylase (PgdA/CDA1 family)